MYISPWGENSDDKAIDGEVFPSYEHPTERIIVDKRTHRIRFEDESEHQVTVVIEPKGWLETPK